MDVAMMKVVRHADTVRWVLAARDGDRAAFERLFEHIAPDLYAWAELRIARADRHHLEPADLVQEVWYRAYRVLDTYDPERVPFRYWLFRVAKNVLLEASRQLERPDRRAHFGQGSGHHALDSFQDEATTVTARLSRDEQLQDFVRQVRELDEDERELLVFCGLEGMPHRQVGERLGLSQSAVAKRWQRLRERLRP